MNLRTTIVTATTAAALATSGVALAGASGSSTSTAPPAQSSTSSRSSTPALSSALAGVERRAPNARAHRLRLRRLLRGAAGVVSKAIGIDRAALREGLRSGRTIAQIATSNQVEAQAVIDAVIAAANSELDRAVTAGRITAARAAKIKERLPARITKIVNEWHPRRVREDIPS